MSYAAKFRTVRIIIPAESSQFVVVLVAAQWVEEIIFSVSVIECLVCAVYRKNICDVSAKTA